MHLLRHARGTRAVNGQDSGPGRGEAEPGPVPASMAI
jgi:hypothetical protein